MQRKKKSCLRQNPEFSIKGQLPKHRHTVNHQQEQSWLCPGGHSRYELLCTCTSSDAELDPVSICSVLSISPPYYSHHSTWPFWWGNRFFSPLTSREAGWIQSTVLISLVEVSRGLWVLEYVCVREYFTTFVNQRCPFSRQPNGCDRTDHYVFSW